MKTTLEEQFPDKNKMYLSPSKESIMVYVEGKWQMFFREDKVTEIKDAAVNAKLHEAAEKKWIESKNEKPTPATPVIAFGINSFGKERTLRAMWVPKFFLESDGEYFDYADYSEEKDEYYWPEGWYERNEYDEVNWHVNHEITHWQPLPTPPVSLQIKQQ